MHVLVVGATGILRPAVRALVQRDDSVLAVARTFSALASMAQELGVDTLSADRSEVPQRLAHLPVGTLDAALLYAPAVDDPLPEAVQRRVTGTVVHVVTSAAAQPVDSDDAWSLDRLPPAAPRIVRLVLGWAVEPGTGRTRWHNPDEISAAALDCLAQRTDAVLGVLRPWSDRPD